MTLPRSLWSLSPYLIALWESIPLKRMSIPRALSLFWKFSDMNDGSLSKLLISGNQIYIEVQQSMKSFRVSVVDLILRIRAPRNLLQLSITCSTILLLTYITSIATALLKMISYGGMVALKLNSDTEKVEHNVHFRVCFSAVLVL